MNVNCTAVTLGLPSQPVVRLDKPFHARVHASAGTVWITIDDDPRDIVLEAGESFEFDSAKPALLSSLHGTAMACVEPASEHASEHTSEHSNTALEWIDQQFKRWTSGTAAHASH